MTSKSSNRPGQSVLARPGAERGLQADQAGVRGRAPDRAAAVLRDGQRADAGGHRRDRAAAGAARRQRRVPGVAGGAEQRVRGVAVVGELGHVGLADQQRAASDGAACGQFVVRRAMIAQRRRAAGGGQVGAEQAVLHCERDAVQRRQRSALRVPLRCRSGLGQHGVVAPRHHRVQARVDHVHACQHRLHHGQRGQTAGAVAALQFNGRQLPKGQTRHRRPHMCAGSQVAMPGTSSSSSVNRIMIAA